MLEGRLCACRMRRLMASWREAAALKARERLRRRRADLHWRGVAGRAMIEALRAGIDRLDPGRQAMAAGRVRRLRLCRYFKVRLRPALINNGQVFPDWPQGDLSIADLGHVIESRLLAHLRSGCSSIDCTISTAGTWPWALSVIGMASPLSFGGSGGGWGISRLAGGLGG